MGIDMGTTNSSVARLDIGPNLIKGRRGIVSNPLQNWNGHKTTPSVVYMPDNSKPIVGEFAIPYAESHPL